MFCLNCGKQIDDDSEFCCFCGEKVQRIKTQPQQKEEPKIESKRNVVYEGSIHKCPNCGEVLKSFEATCPSCGFEFRNTNNHSKKIEEFSNRLKVTKKPEKKRELITSFYVPNTKEDIFEFILLAIAKLDSSNPDEDEKDSCSGAWIAKAEQLFAKAELSLKNDKEYKTLYARFERVKQKHNEKTKKQKHKKVIATVAIVIGVVGFVLLGGTIAGCSSIIASITNKVPDPEPGETILVEYDYSHFKNQNYVDVHAYFVSKGFETVNLNPMGDLITGWLDKENEVDSVSINGNTEFKKKWYKPSDIVIISYHSFKNKS